MLDTATRDLIFQVTQAGSGDVVFQLPSVEALKARIYAQQQERVKTERAKEEQQSKDIKA